MGFIAGIDEAGRGPVIGPMVMAIVACEDEDALKRAGFKDSKLLTPELRERLAAEVDQSLCEIISLSPAEIDLAVDGKGAGDSLNKLEARTTALLIYRLAKRVPITTVIMDSPTRTTANYERDVREALAKVDHEGVTRNIALRAEIKADFNHPVVGAASVLAKVTRDAAIADIAAVHGAIGSGYPSDPFTQRFLQSQWKEEHAFFRKSWESYRRLAQPVQPTLGDFGAEEKHKGVVAAFEALREHGFEFLAPTNPYEIVRMRNAAGVTVISYTTGKLVVQGADAPRAEAERLIASLGLGAAEAKRPRGRPKKNA